MGTRRTFQAFYHTELIQVDTLPLQNNILGQYHREKMKQFYFFLLNYICIVTSCAIETMASNYLCFYIHLCDHTQPYVLKFTLLSKLGKITTNGQV